jgi:hypothetical protein
LVAALGIVACSSETDTDATTDGGVSTDTTTPDTNSLVADTSTPASIYGDWFLCETEKCDKVTYQGWGLHSDGKHPALFAEPPYLEPDETYCSSWKGDLKKYFEVKGDTLVFIQPDKTTAELTIVEVTQDRLVLKGGEATYYQRVDPPRVSGECDPQAPWLCPGSNVGPADGDLYCSWDYTCNTGKYRLLCKKAGTAELSCECWEDEVKKKTFEHPQACKDMTLASSVEVANQGCGWQVWIP